MQRNKLAIVYQCITLKQRCSFTKVSTKMSVCICYLQSSDSVSGQDPRNSDVGRSEYSSPQSRRPPFLLVLRPPSFLPSSPRLNLPPMSSSLPPLLFLARFVLLGFHFGASKSSAKPLLLFACVSPFKYFNSFSPPLALFLAPSLLHCLILNQSHHPSNPF